MIEFSVDQGVATLVFNNPQKRNALEPAVREELAQRVAQVRDDDAVRVLIIAGAGEHFSAGGDLKNIGSAGLGTAGWRARMQRSHRLVEELLTLDKPIIAAVDGVAYGAGFSLALTADFILASTRARFCMSFMKVGFVPDLGAMFTLPRFVGAQRARELMLSAREVGAEEARQLGIAMEVLPPQELMSRARAIAQSMVNASPAAVSMVKRIMANPPQDLASLLDAEANAQAVAAATEEHKTAVQRFLDKQPPAFSWPAR